MGTAALRVRSRWGLMVPADQTWWKVADDAGQQSVLDAMAASTENALDSAQAAGTQNALNAVAADGTIVRTNDLRLAFFAQMTGVTWGVRSANGMLGWNAVGSDGGPTLTGSTAIKGVVEHRPRVTRTVTNQTTWDTATDAVGADQAYGWWEDVTAGKYGATVNVVAASWIIPPRTRIMAPYKYGLVIERHNPDGSGEPVTNHDQPIWCIWDVEMHGVKVLASNCRYAVHVDQDASNVDTTQLLADCWFEHQGNTDSFSGVWTNPPAIGAGSASGQRFRAERCVLVSKGHPFAVHSNRPYSRKSVWELVDTELRCSVSGFGRAILLASLGSGVSDRLSLRNVTTNTHYIEHQTNPWRGDPATNATPHVEWDVTVSGGTVLAWKDTGTAADNITPAPDATYYPNMVEREASCVTTAAISQWQAVVLDGAPDKVKPAPTNATAGQFYGIALFAAASGSRVRILREGKLFPTQGAPAATTFDQPVYLSTTTTGALTTTSGGPQVGHGVGVENITYFKGRDL